MAPVKKRAGPRPPRKKPDKESLRGAPRSLKTGPAAASRRSARKVSAGGEPLEITREVLRRMPLPRPGADDDKEVRGRVLVVGGGTETIGAIILAGTAALRAGAGKLQVTTTEQEGGSGVAYVLPEARFLSGDEGGLTKYLGEADAVCIGPGWTEERPRGPVARFFLSRCKKAAVVLDAQAVVNLLTSGALPRSWFSRAVVTPNAEEFSEVFRGGKGPALRDPFGAARAAAISSGAVIVLKGRETYIVAPDGRAFVNRAGNVGLATSGSGDVLAGLIAGLAARGAAPFEAAVWGVHLHALAGDRLAARVGPLGYLARELPAEVPRLMAELSGD